MPDQRPPGFGGLLRQLRTRAQLTQRQLAKAATLSTRTVSDLERGINRTARKTTAELLAEALDLAGPERMSFFAAARGRPASSSAETSARRDDMTRSVPPAGGLIGRDGELARIDTETLVGRCGVQRRWRRRRASSVPASGTRQGP